MRWLVMSQRISAMLKLAGKRANAYLAGMPDDL